MTNGIATWLAGRGLIPRSLPAFIAAVLVLLLAIYQTSALRPLVYQVARDAARANLLHQVAGWETQTSEHFVVKFLPEDRDIAPIVLEAAEAAYALVTRDLAYVPPGRTAVVIYPTREKLSASFGWSAQESAMGVYWGGAIRVLSPKAWVEGRDLSELAEVFHTMGPMAHEFTHLVLDYKTRGNYPRWFSEGLAQYEEIRRGGFIWNDPAADLGGQLYSLAELERFGDLPNEGLAYRQALSLVEYLVQTCGEEAPVKIVAALAEGATFRQALTGVGVSSPAALEAGWLAWLKAGQGKEDFTPPGPKSLLR